MKWVISLSKLCNKYENTCQLLWESQHYIFFFLWKYLPAPLRITTLKLFSFGQEGKGLNSDLNIGCRISPTLLRHFSARIRSPRSTWTTHRLWCACTLSGSSSTTRAKFFSASSSFFRTFTFMSPIRSKAFVCSGYFCKEKLR